MTTNVSLQNNTEARECLDVNKKSWDEAAPRFFGRTPLPNYGVFSPTENELNLLGDVSNLKVLDIGCGSGHSLKYMASRNAAELWGIDLSDSQLDAARKLLEPHASMLHLIQSPMEEDPGIPHNYFDVVYSIFAIGWTVDLQKTLQNVFNYLKPGGLFIFSWEHPLHNRFKFEGETLVMNKSYHQEGLYRHEAWKQPAIMNHLRISTYINELINAGFQIQKLIEDVSLPENPQPNINAWYSYEKAQFVPDAFIIKARK